MNGDIETTYIQSVPQINNDDDSQDGGSQDESEDESISSSELEEPLGEEEALRNFVNEINQNQNTEEENHNHLDDFLFTSNAPPDMNVDEIEQGSNE